MALWQAFSMAPKLDIRYIAKHPGHWGGMPQFGVERPDLAYLGLVLVSVPSGSGYAPIFDFLSWRSSHRDAADIHRERRVWWYVGFFCAE